MPFFSGIATAIVGALGIAGTFLGGATAFIIKAAIGIGLSYAAQALAGKPKQQKSQQAPFSVQGKLRASGEIPRSFIGGKGATAGSLVYPNTWGETTGTPNAYIVQVISLSDLPSQSLDQVWVNGELCTLDDTPHADFGYPVLEYRVGTKDHLWVKFYDGTQTDADAYLVDKFSDHDTWPYESTRVGTGITYVICTARVNDELFTGFPEFKFAITGAKLYDPTADTTAGGSGSQRWDTPSTWGGADGDHLPIVQLYNICRGITYGGEWFYGLQNVAAAQLPDAAWIAAINVCRATKTGPDGSEAQYRSGGEIPVNARIAETVEALLTACQGRLAEIGGFYKPHAGAPGSSGGSFTDGDIISTAGQSFTPFYGLADTINGIAAKYPEPAEGWNIKPAPTRYDADFEAEDGNRRLMADVDYSMVPYGGQVQRLMQSALDEARRARRHTFTLPAEFWQHEPGDVLSWTSERNGYEAKLFRIDGMADLANLDVLVDITEVDPADYDWDQGTDYVTPVDGRVGIARPAPQPIVDWFAEAYAVPDNDGTGRRPAIKLSWDGDVDDVEAVQYQVRLPGSPPEIVRDGSTLDVEKASVVISENLLSNTTYEVRGRYIPRSDRRTLWSNETFGGSPPEITEGEWFEVTTPDIGITESELDASIRALLAQLDVATGAAIKTVLDELRERIEAAEQNAAGLTALVDQFIQTSLVTYFGNANANITEVRTIADGLAALYLNVFAGNEVAAANALLQIAGQVTESGALASVDFRLKAEIGQTSSSTGLRLIAAAVEAGGQSIIEMEAGRVYIVNPDTGARLPLHMAVVQLAAEPVLAVDGVILADLSNFQSKFKSTLTESAFVEWPIGVSVDSRWSHRFKFNGTGLTLAFNDERFLPPHPVLEPNDGAVVVLQFDATDLDDGTIVATVGQSSGGQTIPPEANLWTWVQDVNSSNVEVCFDYASAGCYDSAVDAQVINDLSGNGSNAQRGSSSGADNYDPTFNGTPGALDDTNSFTLGATREITFPTTPATFADTMHQDNSSGTILALVKLPAAPSSPDPSGFEAPASNKGIATKTFASIFTSNGAIRIDPNGFSRGVNFLVGNRRNVNTNITMRFVVRNGFNSNGSPFDLQWDTGTTARWGEWNVFAAAWDETVGANGFTMMMNSTITKFTSTYVNPAGSGLQLKRYSIGRASGDGAGFVFNDITNPLSWPGTEVANLMVATRRWSDAELLALYKKIRLGRPGFSLPE